MQRLSSPSAQYHDSTPFSNTELHTPTAAATAAAALWTPRLRAREIHTHDHKASHAPVRKFTATRPEYACLASDGVLPTAHAMLV